MQQIISLFKAELIRQWKVMLSYPFELITSTISYLLITFVILLGIKRFGSELQMVGIIILPFLMNLVSGMSASIRSDVQIGTFEQVYNSKYSLYSVCIIRTIVNALISAMLSIVIAIIVFIWFYRFQVNIYMLVLVLSIAILLSLTLSTFFAGCTLTFRKIDTFLNFFNIILLFILTIPYFSWNHQAQMLCALFIPYSGAVELLQTVSNPSSTINVLLIVFATLINCLLWSVFSFYMYNKCLQRSRLRGTLGMY